MHTDRWPLVLCAGIFVASSVALAAGPRRPGAPQVFSFGHPFNAPRAAAPESAAEIASAAANPTDQALAEYALAVQHLDRGELQEARALLKEARNRPLAVDSASGGGVSPGNISAASQLLLVATYLSRMAVACAEQGDVRAATAWVRSSREVAAQILETERPTIEGLLAARSIDAKTGRAEVKAYRLLKREGEARKAEARERALKLFYDREVMTRVVKMREAREELVRVSLKRGEDEAARRGAFARQDRRDDELAGVLIESYQAERTRLLS